MTRSLVVLVVLAGVAHAETRPDYAGKVEASLLGAPATFDPVAAQTHAEITVSELVFDTLYRVELRGAVTPHLASEPPDYDAGKQVARIAIRKGVKFHDGATLTPADVAASLERARRGAGAWALSPIASVRAGSDWVEVTLKAPVDVALMLALAPSAITRHGKAPGAKPSGTGPFELEVIDRAGGKLVLKAFEDHFAGRPYINQLVLRWHDKTDAEPSRFQTDESQLSARGVAAFAGGQPKFRASFVNAPNSVLVFVGFGGKHASVTGDLGFRRALDFALDRGALTSVNRGEGVAPAGEPVPAEAGGAQPSLVVRNGDLGQARAALTEAGTRVGALAQANLPQLTLEIAFEITRPDDREIAERVARALGKLGIAASLAGVSAVELRDRATRGTTDLWIGQLAAPVRRGTQWPWWSAAFALAGSSWGATQLASGDLVDPKGHAAAQKEFAAKKPFLPLMFRGIKMWHRTDLHGLRFDATGRACFAELYVWGSPVRTKP
ncbi:MAG: ABC transporter substrate-binding protein [Kofleriaceae bacterium]